MDARIYWCWLQLALPPGNRLAGPFAGAVRRRREIYEAGEGALREAEIPEPELTRLLNKELGPARAASGGGARFAGGLGHDAGRRRVPAAAPGAG